MKYCHSFLTTNRPIKYSNEFNKHFNMNLIKKLQSLKVTCLMLTFRTLARAKIYAVLDSLQFKASKVHFHIQIHINQNVLAHAVNQIVCLNLCYKCLGFLLHVRMMHQYRLHIDASYCGHVYCDISIDDPESGGSILPLPFRSSGNFLHPFGVSEAHNGFGLWAEPTVFATGEP